MLSIGALFLLVFSLIPLGVMGQEGPQGAALTGGNELIDTEAIRAQVEAAASVRNLAQAYYQLTRVIVAIEASIDYMGENHADVDMSAMASIKADAESVRDSLTTESDFDSVRDQTKAFVADARETMNTIVKDNGVDKDALKAYVQDAVESSSELADARSTWGETRSAFVYARGDVAGAQLDNFLTIAEAAGIDVSEIRALVDERNAALEALAAAVSDFDQDGADGLREQIVDLTQQIKALAQDLKDQIREARKEQMAANNGIAAAARDFHRAPPIDRALRYTGEPLTGHDLVAQGLVATGLRNEGLTGSPFSGQGFEGPTPFTGQNLKGEGLAADNEFTDVNPTDTEVEPVTSIE